MNECLNKSITSIEIDKMIDKCNNDKTPSQHDNILNEHIKCTKTIMVALFCKLFYAMLDTGILPDSWLVGSIRPICAYISPILVLSQVFNLRSHIYTCIYILFYVCMYA